MPNVDFTIYGEGVGGKIQKPSGMQYFPDGSYHFIAFDIQIGRVWVDDDAVRGLLGTGCGVEVAPMIGGYGVADPYEITRMLRSGCSSQIGERDVEGVVVKSMLPLFDTYGNRAIWKLRGEELK